MTGAIFFSGKYGSTAQYANWIGEAAGLPVFDVNDANVDPSKFDFVILGSSIVMYKLTIRKWARASLAKIVGKPLILFTVSGAPPGPKVDEWVAHSLPATLTSKMVHVALRGKLDHTKIGWWVKLLLKIGAWTNDDPKAKQDELLGFDYMDRSSIKPILEGIQKMRCERQMD